MTPRRCGRRIRRTQVFSQASKRALPASGIGTLGEKAATAIADFLVVDMFANYCTGREGRQGRDRGCRTAVEAHLSLSETGAGGERLQPARCRLDAAACAHDDLTRGYRPWLTSHSQPRSAKPQIREATTWDQLKTNRNWLGFWFMLPAMAFLILFLAYPLGLGIWISFTDAQDRTARRIHRDRELRVAVGRFDLLALGLQHAALHLRRERDQIRDRSLSGAAAEREHAVQGDAARAGADPLHRADRAVGAGVLVDLRFAVLDHLVVAASSSA